MRVLGAVVVLVAFTAVAGGATAARVHDQRHAQAAQKPRCLWPKRECHPPANLWYRVLVGFRGVLTRHSSENAIPNWVRTTELKWRFVSHHAVRLRLMCDDELDASGPFLVQRRINGKRRTIGGCGPDPRRGLRTSLRFAATGSGETTRRTNTFVAAPVDGPVERCEGYTSTSNAPTQALSGAIRTTGGSVGGMEISISPIGRVMGPTGTPPTYTCTNKVTGASRTRTGDHGNGGACCHIFGSTQWHQRDSLGQWRSITERLRFSPTASNFGRRYAANLAAEQEELKELDVKSIPPAGTPWLFEEQAYSYAIVLTPCPNQGLDVGRC
jgi:hypothetical protein